MLRLHPRTIRNRIKAGLLPAKQITGGKSKLIAKTDALALLVDAAPDPGMKPPLVIPAGVAPLSVTRTPRDNPLATPEGRARAIDMLRRLREDDGDEEEQRRAAKALEHITPLALREWSVGDVTRIESEHDNAGKAA